ncbi:glycosyltransferase involved in cell wall biosynthesis [Rhabdobacter roseus]|uniref:Glycosyltransferase involved in cell wall biosynthesis n=2 Tax=Rhabdobacter roseus TaxID=1655419 RepID=A0A840TH22_9BACT|nr:glycosyltransferase involved in cell wall biosynthesis [Rhabdobacter roseus]
MSTETTPALPLVSIALCVYNGEKYLRAQLDTLVHQTYPHLEIVAVDDCSRDASVAILKEYQEKYPFLRISANEKNLGYTKNFEKALTLCRGELLALADQDDVWELDKIRLQVQALDSNLLIYHDSAFLNEAGKPVHKKMSDIIRLYRGNEPETFLLFNCVSGHSCLFRRALLPYILPFPVEFPHDQWIAYVATNLGTIDFLPQCLVGYRQHNANSTDILNRRRKIDKKYHENRDLAKLRRDLKWIKQCATFRANKNQAFLDEFVWLFEERLASFFSFRYARLIQAHYEKLYFIPYKRNTTKGGFVRRQAWGLRAKLLWERYVASLPSLFD